jgi:hypothetical protein
MTETTGSMNAMIDTYKPDDFFKNGGVISIIYDGDIVATLHIERNEVKETDITSQLAAGNYSKYLIRGTETDIRRFIRFCNKDIPKGDYLLFNGSPPSKGLAAEEHAPSSSFFRTPPREPKRKPTFDEWLDRLGEVAEDPPGSPYAEPVLKTVYVLVSMHGEDKRNPLPRIENTVYILPSGLCSAPLETPSEQYTRLTTFRGLPSALIEGSYQMESDARIKALQQNVEKAVQSGYTSDIFHQLTESQKPRRLSEYADVTLHVGPLLQDREYTDDSTAHAFTQCISILGSNWKDSKMKRPHGTFTHPSLAEKINSFYKRLSKPRVTQKEAEDQLQRFQSLNLLNVEVLKAFTEHVAERDIPFEKFKGIINGEEDQLTISTNGTGIPHYNHVRLSHLLILFQKLGFEKVVVFDEGCRTGDMFSTSGRAQEEYAEAASEGTLRRPMKKGDYGGRRTRRHRRRSRRFHKKS